MSFTLGNPRSDETIGYVTWSSMMSGLRSHLLYTITCVSERSGIASSLVLLSEYHPSVPATAVNMKTMNLLRAQISMIRFIIGQLPASIRSTATTHHRSRARMPLRLHDGRRHTPRVSSDQRS